MQGLGLVRIAEDSVMQALAMIRITKNTKSTVSKAEGVLDGMSYAGFRYG